MRVRGVAHALCVLALLGPLSGCTGGDDAEVADPGVDIAEPEEPSPTPTSTPSADQGDTPATAATVTSLVEPGTFGLEGIAVVPTASGQGPRPQLEWEPVDGAVVYSVVVQTPDGSPYWAWEGVETSVPVGGRPQLRDDAPGPRVVAGMRWLVTALDGDFRTVAISGWTPLEP